MRLNNPFKMIGPWIGASVYLVANIISISGDNVSDWNVLNLPFGFLYMGGETIGWLIFPLVIGLQVIVGFLLGWGIQALIRKIRR